MNIYLSLVDLYESYKSSRERARVCARACAREREHGQYSQVVPHNSAEVLSESCLRSLSLACIRAHTRALSL